MDIPSQSKEPIDAPSDLTREQVNGFHLLILPCFFHPSEVAQKKFQTNYLYFGFRDPSYETLRKEGGSCLPEKT